MNHFCYQKKFVRWDRYKSLEQKKEICHHNKFKILSEEIGNEELSIVLLKSSLTLLIPLLRTYQLYLQQKSEKRCLECHEKFIVFKG